jgi:hypothetical protein
MSYDGRSTPDQTTNNRDVQSPQRQHQSSTSMRGGKTNNNGNGGGTSRGRERQGRDKDGNPLSLRLNDRERKKEPSASPTSVHVMTTMQADGTNNAKKNSSLNDRHNAADNDESNTSDHTMTDDGGGTAAIVERTLIAPQISPMKPLSPIGVEIGLETTISDDR